MTINVETTNLAGLLLFKPRRFSDDRGYFFETFRMDSYSKAGISQSFVQDNCSMSSQGVLRGLHFQWPQPQGKLITVAVGRIFDVAVDIRRGSPQFCEWFGVELSADNGWQLYVPEGFAHGFCALESGTVIQYKCTDYYSPSCEKTLIWNDPKIKIQWPITAPNLSAKDLQGKALSDFSDNELPIYERR